MDNARERTHVLLMPRDLIHREVGGGLRHPRDFCRRRGHSQRLFPVAERLARRGFISAQKRGGPCRVIPFPKRLR